MTATWQIIEGDCLASMRSLPDGIAQTCITSPPYYGLRDYGHDGQIGLEESPAEYVQRLVEVFREVRRVLRDDGTVWLNLGDSYASGGMSNPSASSTLDGGKDRGAATYSIARNVPTGTKPKDLLGIPWMVAEALKAPYYTGRIKDERDRIWLAAMIDAEGCIFIHKRKAGQSNGQGYVRQNDSYGSGLEVSNTSLPVIERIAEIVGLGSISTQGPDENARRKQTLYRWNLRTNECRSVLREVYPYLVAKQHEARLAIGCPSSGPDAATAHESLKSLHQGGLPGIDFPAPESMFERGWFLRSEIIWAKLPKPNPMPESVTDRPTKAHEQVFLLAKSARYFYDADAVREELADANAQRTTEHYDTADRYGVGNGGNGGLDSLAARMRNGEHNGRNKRTVWTVTTQPFSGAHFAVFPPKLIEPCVLAGSSDKACGECGQAWERVVEPAKTEPDRTQRSTAHYDTADRYGANNGGNGGFDALAARMRAGEHGRRTVGFGPACTCNAPTVPSIVLDPFAGSGTTGVVALRHGRSFIGCELNPEYAAMARDRIRDDAPLLNTPAEVCA